MWRGTSNVPSPRSGRRRSPARACGARATSSGRSSAATTSAPSTFGAHRRRGPCAAHPWPWAVFPTGDRRASGMGPGIDGGTGVVGDHVLQLQDDGCAPSGLRSVLTNRPRCQRTRKLFEPCTSVQHVCVLEPVYRSDSPLDVYPYVRAAWRLRMDFLHGVCAARMHAVDRSIRRAAARRVRMSDPTAIRSYRDLPRTGMHPSL